MINIFGNKNRIGELETKLAEVQHALCEITTYNACERTDGTGGNQYPTADAQIKELAAKYEGSAQWGSHFAQNVIAVRAAFTIGQGVKVSAKEGAGNSERELKWIENFNHLNNLDEEIPQGWAEEAEIEGKALVRLFVGKAPGEIFARFIPWTHTKYEITSDADDYADYISAAWKNPDDGAAVEVPAEEFVYKKFGGRVHHVNDTPPKVGAVLCEMENLHKALDDWRKINKLFACPTPHFKVEDKRQVDELKAMIAEMKWKIGKVLITTADFSMVGIDAAGVKSLAEEITTNAKIISGNTGVPVHFLGFPELMSNRSTSDNLLELVVASTNKARRIWSGAYEELYHKAITLANEQQNAGLNPDAFAVEIPQISAAKIKELQEVWLPIYEAGALSLEGFLAKVPDIDTKEEIKRLEAKEEEAAAAVLETIKAAKSDAAHGGDELDAAADASKQKGDR